MVSKVRWSASVTLLLAVVLLASSIGFAGDIDPQLAARLASVDGEEFVRVFLRMEDQPFVSAAMGPEVTRFILREAAERSQEPVLAYLQVAEAAGDVRALNAFWLVNLVFVEAKADMVATLADLPGVAYVYEDFQLTVPRDELRTDVTPQALLWDHLGAVFAPEVWAKGFLGQGITVAVADTGVDISHPELVGALGGVAPLHEGYWAEFDEIGRKVAGSVPHDSSDHGTHVSGTVGARNVEFQFGVAPQVTLAHALVIPEGSGSWAQVIGGLQWVAEQQFDIVNGSFGANTTNPDLAVATDNLAAAGVVPVFSNGNIRDGTFPPGVPGNTPSALAVGAYDRHGLEASFNRGNIIEYPGYEYDEFTRIKPDISAPGVDILSTLPNGRYGYGDGTSMSSPHVAGVAALLLSANPTLTVQEVKEILFSTTGGHKEGFGWDDIPTKDIHFGWGRLNALQAVEAAKPSGPAVEVVGAVMAETNPVAGATVTFKGPSTHVFTTDADGRYEGAVEEGFYTITAAATAYLPETRTVTVINTGEVVENYFILEPAPLGGVVGTVLDAQTGEPLEGVTVSVVDGQVEQKTAVDGTYALNLPEGVVSLEFSKTGYFDNVVSAISIVPEHTARVDASIQFGSRTLLGEVTDATGDRVSGATVHVAETGDGMTTGADGAFGFDLPAGAYNVSVSKLGLVTASVATAVQHGAVTTVEVELAPNVGSLTGTVTSIQTDGGEPQPAAGAVISVLNLGEETVTADDGTYSFESLPVGNWRILVEHEDHYPQEATAVIEADETTVLDVVLQLPRSLVLFHTGFDSDDEQTGWTFIDYAGAGGWHFTDHRAYSSPFSAWHGDTSLPTGWYPPNQAAGIVSPPLALSEGKLELTFRMWGHIWGPFHAFGVFLLDLESGQEDLLYVFDAGTPTDDWIEVSLDLSKYSGRLVTLEFYVESDFLTRAADQGIFIDDVTIDHTESALEGRIAGIVADAGGKPIEGAAVTVVELAPAGGITRMSQTMTDADGEYELSVAAGGWTVQAGNAPTHVPSRHVTYVEPGGSTALDFSLHINAPPASVTGLQAHAGDGSVLLTWDAVADDDLAGYNVYRSLDGDHFNRIGTTQDTSFTEDGLQNGYTYYFRVAAMDELGLEGEAEEIAGTPADSGPKVSVFDVKPRSLQRGGSIAVSAQLEHASDTDALLHVRVQAALAGKTVREWEFEDESLGTFSAVLDTVDVFGKPWAPNVYQMTMFVTDGAGGLATSNTINVALLAPLPRALSFLLGNNPFNPQTESQMLEYTVPSDGHVHVAVYTLDGQRLRILVDERKAAGQYAAFWDGTDGKGNVVLAGMYVVRARFTDADGQSVDLTRHSVVVK